MIIKSSMTVEEIHAVIGNLPARPKPTVDDILVAIADAAAHRAVMELIDYGEYGEPNPFWN